MARRRPFPRRKRIFVAAEGDGERAFARWLQELCDEQGLHLHLDIVVAGGGDTRSVVEFAVERRRRHADSKGRDKGALVLVDTDRLAQDRANRRDPETVKGRERLQLLYLAPKLEGLLLRLHSGYETQFVEADDVERRLQRLWPEYEKPMSATALGKRFNLASLRRAAAHDSHLRNALSLLLLMPRA